MRSAIALCAASLLLAPSALAAQPEEQPPAEPRVDDALDPTPPPRPEPPPPPPPAEPDRKDAPPVVRDSGMRLGLDLGFARASTARSDNLTNGSPSLIPFGVDVSFRTSERVLLGFHGSMALASRDDCLSSDHCTARDYTFGPHVEAAFGSSKTIIPWFRYGMNVEMMYRGGSAGDGGAHEYRDGFDLLDARLGADLVLGRNAEGKTTRIGAFVGMIGGVGLGNSGATGDHRPLSSTERSGGHVWFTLGLRGTLDP